MVAMLRAGCMLWRAGWGLRYLWMRCADLNFDLRRFGVRLLGKGVRDHRAEN